MVTAAALASGEFINGLLGILLVHLASRGILTHTKRRRLSLGSYSEGQMNDSLMRQWAMLRLIPRFPRCIDAPIIHSQLLGQGMTVSLRTVQRDLNSLATTFLLDFDESKPQGWCWREGASQLEIPSMDAHAALTFNLVEQYMQNMLPRSTLNQMAPWFKAAEGVANSQVSSVSKLRDKLRVIPHTLCKVPAPINRAIQASTYNGLLNESQI
jgi:hypothetical protein